MMTANDQILRTEKYRLLCSLAETTVEEDEADVLVRNDRFGVNRETQVAAKHEFRV